MNQVTRTSRIEEVSRPAWTLEAHFYVPVHDGEVPFAFPAFGPGLYSKVVKYVLNSKQRPPTGEQTAFMLDESYNSTVPEVKNSPRTQFVRDDIIHNGWLWVPSINVWTPRDIENPGMYAVFDETGQGLGKVYTSKELEDR